MNNAITLRPQTQIVNYTQEQIQVIKNTVAQGATDTELALFINQCKRTGLDALTRQIYFIKDNKGKVTIQTSVDGFRLIAERSGSYEGQTAPMWCGQDGVWKDVWLSKTPPAACKVGVYKAGFREALFAVALFEEYAQKKYDGTLSHMWGKMPALMIQKVAECLALRRAFPNDLSGLYSQEEMAQSAPVEKRLVAPVETFQNVNVEAEQVISHSEELHPPRPSEWEQPEVPTADPSVDFDPHFTISFGKYKGQTLDEVGPDNVWSYAGFLRSRAAEVGKPIEGAALEFIKQAEAYMLAIKGK